MSQLIGYALAYEAKACRFESCLRLQTWGQFPAMVLEIILTKDSYCKLKIIGSTPIVPTKSIAEKLNGQAAGFDPAISEFDSHLRFQVPQALTSVRAFF